jgi:hypothetical protein
LGSDHLTLVIVELLSYCNFTLNFFIYFATSSKFREEFFKFIDETSINLRRLCSPTDQNPYQLPPAAQLNSKWNLNCWKSKNEDVGMNHRKSAPIVNNNKNIENIPLNNANDKIDNIDD